MDWLSIAHGPLRRLGRILSIASAPLFARLRNRARAVRAIHLAHTGLVTSRAARLAAKVLGVKQRATINIAVSLHDAGGSQFVKAAAVMYVSMRLATCQRLHFYVIHDETITPVLRDRLRQTIVADDEITFVNINDYPLASETCRSLAESEHLQAVYWRLFLADMLELDQIIICDADLIVLFDILRLWHKDLEGNVLSGVFRKRPHVRAYHELIEAPPEGYFRCGFLKVDLKAMRRNGRFREERLAFMTKVLPEANKLVPLHEQTVFNHFFANKCLPMDVELVPFRNQAPERLMELAKLVSLDTPTVLDIKGWDQMPHAAFYWAYLLLTPWRAEAFDHLSQANLNR